MSTVPLYTLKGHMRGHLKTHVDLKHCVNINGVWYKRRYFMRDGDIHSMTHDSSNGLPNDIGFDYVELDSCAVITETIEEKDDGEI